MRKLTLQIEKSPPAAEIKFLDEYADPDPSPLPFPTPRGIVSIGDRLGAGAEGVVYRVETERFGSCALKWAFVSPMASFLTHRLLDEAKTMEAIGPHPHLVRLYDYGTERTSSGSYDWLLMELHLGDINGWMNVVLRRPWELSEENRIEPERFEKMVLLDGMSGLEHMHSKGFIHRDVKLANMGLKPSMRALVADLGFARRITRPDGTLVAEGERTFIPAGTQAFVSVRVEKSQHQYYGDDIQSLLFSFLAYTYLYETDIFYDGLGRALEKQDILDRPDQYGTMSEEQKSRKKRAKEDEFVQNALGICLEQENLVITDHLFQWYVKSRGEAALHEQWLDTRTLQETATRVRDTGFFMLLLGWAARASHQTLSGLARELLSQYAQARTRADARLTRVAWEVLVELSGAPLRSYLFPFIRSPLAYQLSESCYEGKPLPALTRLFVPDLAYLSPTSLITAFQDLDSFPPDAKLLVYDDSDVVVERGFGRYSPSVRVSLATNEVDGPAFICSPQLVINSLGATRLTAIGLRTVSLCVVFLGSADIPLGQLRRLEVNGSDWADAKSGKLPTGVIVLNTKDGQVSAFPTKLLDPEFDLADPVLMPRPIAPDSVVRFRKTDGVYLCLFNVVNVAVRLQ